MFVTTEERAQRTGPVAMARPAERGLETEFAWRVLEEIDYGLLLVSPAGGLQHANQLARQELARERFLRVEDGRLQGHCIEQTEEVQRGVRSAAIGRRQMLTLRNGPLSLAVACVPLFQPQDGESASVLLMLARQNSTRNLSVTFFARSHGLTPAEETVLRSLCDGLDVHEIATANGVSENTVRTQVRSLRDKTGISSMRLLVQKVASLPPVVPVTLCGMPAATRPQ
jgi:DNA-binding CsgD family transcriptional regulator